MTELTDKNTTEDVACQAVTAELDVMGLACPLPLLKAKQALRDLQAGDTLRVLATDAGSERDFHSFVDLSEHAMWGFAKQDNRYIYILQKG